MEQENESAQEVVVEQEEQTAEDTNSVTLSKAEFTKLQRKAIAYDVNKKQPKEEIISKSITPRDILQSEEMKLYREGYDEKQIEFIMHNGGRKVLEDKNSPVSVAISALREQAKAEDAANRTQEGSQLSEVERKFTPEQLANMPTAELEKVLPHA